MVNESQRGYLSGILQRGARPMAHANRANHPWPNVPSAMQFFGPVPDVNAPPEVDTPGESSYQARFTGTEQSLGQPWQAADPQTYEPEQDSSIDAADSRARPAVDAPSQDLFRPASSPFDSLPQGAEPSAAGSGNALLPIRHQTQNEATPAQEGMDFWERKIPRLIETEHAAEAVVADNSASNIREARADIANREGQRRVLALPGAAPSPFDNRGPSPGVVWPRSRATANNPNQPEMNPQRENGSVKGESIESMHLVREGRVTVAEDLQAQKNAALHESLQEQSRKSEPARLLEVVAGAPSHAPDSIEPGPNLVLAHDQTEPREKSLVWRPFQPKPADDQFTRGAARQQYSASREEASKLTINRLDVQIINQSAPPVLQPPAPAPAPQSDGWENLDRYHLGHLNAIF